MGRVHRQVGRRCAEFWSSDDCRVRCRNEWHLVPVVGRVLRRRGMGQRSQQLERPGNISQSIIVTSWIASGRAALQISNGCFTRTIIPIRTKLELRAAYYPGSDYVDWLGLSVYGQQYKDEPNPDIPSLVNWPYEEMSRLDPHKPIMIAEWATGEFPHSGEGGGVGKPEWIRQGLKLFPTRFPRIKAAVYWHERWQNADGSYSNLRVNSSVESLRAYREGVANPDWLGDLILRPIPKPRF